MVLIKIVNYFIVLLYIALIINTFFPIIRLNISIEKKIIRVITNTFMVLFIWSVYRFVNRISVANIYDYLIILLNGGLFVVAFLNSRQI